MDSEGTQLDVFHFPTTLMTLVGNVLRHTVTLPCTDEFGLAAQGLGQGKTIRIITGSRRAAAWRAVQRHRPDGGRPARRSCGGRRQSSGRRRRPPQGRQAQGAGGAQRSPLLPQVPTLAELGHKNRGRRRRAVWLFPAQRTPATIVAAYTQALKTILEMPQVKAQFAPRSCQTHVQPPEEFAAAIRRESEIWRGVVAATGSTPQG